MASPDLHLEWHQNAGSPPESSKPRETEKATGENLPDLNSVEALNEPPKNDYPHGMRLVLIMISLMLSIFLVSLDNVSG